MSHPLVAGIDTGGTNTRVALAPADAPASILVQRSCPTPRPGTEPVHDAITRMVSECTYDLRGPVYAAGCAVPGMTDTVGGIVLEAANLPGWGHIPLQKELQDRLGVPARVGNDVNLAALAEATLGMAQGCSSMVYMTISTGIAAGIVMHGELVHGAHYCVGEIGNIIPEPRHLKGHWRPNGCLESLAGGAGLATEWYKRRGKVTGAHAIFSAAEENDPIAPQLIRRTENYLCQAALAISSVTDPQMLVVGSAIGLNQPRIASRITDTLERTLLFPPEVTFAALGPDAPTVGALVLASRANNPC